MNRIKNLQLQITRRSTPLFREKYLVFHDLEIQKSRETVERHDQGVHGAMTLAQAVYAFDAAILPVGGIEAAGKSVVDDDNVYAENLWDFVYENNTSLNINAEDDDSRRLDVSAFTSVRHKPGELILIYEDLDGAGITIDSEPYFGLMWPGIRSELDDLFADYLSENHISERSFVRFMKQAKKLDGFKGLVREIAEDKRNYESSVSFGRAIEEFERIRSGWKSAATTETMSRMSADVEAGEKRKEVKDAEIAHRAKFAAKEKLPKRPLPTKLTLAKEEFLKQANDLTGESALKNLDPGIILDRLKDFPVNALQWNHSNLPQLQDVYNDLINLGVIDQNPVFFNNIFAVLRNAADPETNPYLKDPETAKFFHHPEKYREELRDLPPEKEFLGGEMFLAAYDNYRVLQRMINTMNNGRQAVYESQEKLNSPGHVGKVTDALARNLNTFTKAVREGDWTTAGIYAVGVFAIYKTYERLTSGTNGDAVKKWMTYGAAIYAANIFAEKAGYDLLKMAGFKNKDFEVKGTPMEAMRQILMQTDLDKDKQDLDYSVVVRVADVPLTKMDKLFEKADKEGMNFIHPWEFQGMFPEEVLATHPFEMGLVEQGPGYEGLHSRLSPNQKEYVRLGKELFKIALAMRKMYEVTLYNDHPAYINVPYEKAIRNPNRNLLKVSDMMAAMAVYSGVASDKFWAATDAEKIRGQLSEAFGKDSDFWVNEKALGPGHFEGTLMGMPIVLVRDRTQFKVYLKSAYGPNYNTAPGRDFLPLSIEKGDARDQQIATLKTKVTKSVADMLKNLSGFEGKEYVFDDGKLVYTSATGGWTAPVRIPGIDHLSGSLADEKTAIATITVLPDGKSLNVKSGKLFDFDINVDIARQRPQDHRLMRDITSQPEFAILERFRNKKKLIVEKTDIEVDAAKGIDKRVIKLAVGKRRLPLTVTYDPKQKKYVISPEDEKRLLAPNGGFALEMKELLSDNRELDEVVESWHKLIDNTDESYIIHLIEQTPQWLEGATKYNWFGGFALEHFSGSVAKNYTKMLIEAQKQLVLSKIAHQVSDAKSFEDVSKVIGMTLNPAIAELRDQRENFAKLKAKHERNNTNITAFDYRDNVLKPLTRVGTKSEFYQTWHAKFVGDIFQRYGMDDWRDSNARKARDVINVFTHYTAAIDTADLDNNGVRFVPSPDIQKGIEAIKDLKIDAVMAEKVKALVASPEIFDANPKEKAEVEAMINALKTAGIAAGDLPKIVEIVEARDKLAEQENFDLKRSYVNYVIWRIDLRMQEQENFSGTDVPPPGTWDIDHFEQWKETGQSAPDPFIDVTPRVPSADEQVTLVEFLSWKGTLAENELRLKKEGKKLIMPRESFTLTGLDSEKKAFAKDFLAKVSTASILRKDPRTPQHLSITKFPDLTENLSEVETMFFNALDDELRAIRDHKDFGPHLKKKMFQRFRASLIPAYISETRGDKTNVFRGTFKFDAKGGATKFVPGSSPTIDPFVMIIEQAFRDKTMTRKEQELLIRKHAASLIQEQMLSKEKFPLFFDEPDGIMDRVWDWFGQKYTDLKYKFSSSP